MQRLDDVCGPAGWQCRYPHANGKTVCEIGIKVDGEWLWKADGAGDTDYEAEKGAMSDAFKRAAVRWGIGRYLYDLGNIWVGIKAQGKSYAIEDGEYKKLIHHLERHGAPPKSSAQAKRDGDWEAIAGAIRAAQNLSELRNIWDQYRPMIIQLREEWIEELTSIKDEKKAELAAAKGTGT